MNNADSTVAPPLPTDAETPAIDAASALKPRVLYLDHVGVLGGAELSLIDMARAGGDRDHVILMSDGPLKSSLEETGVGVTIIPASRQLAKCRRRGGLISALRSIPYVLWLACEIAKRAKPYDLLWANSQKSFVIGCFAAARSGKPLVWHMRDILSAEHFSTINRRAAVMLANRFAARVITVSNAGLQSFIESGGRAELAGVVYNGIDADEFDAIDPVKARGDLAREFPVGNAPVIGAFGRLAEWKGQHILIRALAQMPGMHALIVGEALFAEKDYPQSLRRLAREIGVADRTHFLGFRKEIPRLMSAVNVVVNTSIAPEPFGRVIVEAMLARRPIIGTNAGGAKEIITHGKDGILVESSDPQSLAAAIGDLLCDPQRAGEIAENGYQTAVQRFGLSRFLESIERIKVGVASEWRT